MRKVIDSNFLTHEELRRYLARSRSSEVVLTDFLAIEAYKDDALAGIFPAMEILRHFPRQVVILRPTESVLSLSGRGSGLQRRLIDQQATNEFGRFCEGLRRAAHGSKFDLDQLTEKGKDASDFVAGVDLALDGFLDDMSRIAETFTHHELKIMRRGDRWTKTLVEKFTEHVFSLALLLFGDDVRIRRLPNFKEAVNTFVFRRSLMTAVYVVNWICVGCPTRSVPRLRRDQLDLNFATYATFFDGLLTRDKRLRDTFLVGRKLLRDVYYPN